MSNAATPKTTAVGYPDGFSFTDQPMAAHKRFLVDPIDQFVAVAKERYGVEFAKQDGKLVHVKSWNTKNEWDDTPENVVGPIKKLTAALAKHGLKIDAVKTSNKSGSEFTQTETLTLDYANARPQQEGVLTDKERNSVALNAINGVLNDAREYYRGVHAEAQRIFGQAYYASRQVG